MNIERHKIKELKKGSYDAFTVLYKMYVAQLYSFVNSITQSNVLTKDIVQETFIKVWLNREYIDEAKSFKNYLYTIARNQLLNELRKKINHTLPLDTLQLTDEDDFADLEGEIDEKEMLQRVSLAKQNLPPRQLQLFEMNKEQGLSVSEIIKITHLSEQSVRNQLSLAMKTLKRILQSTYLTLFL